MDNPAPVRVLVVEDDRAMAETLAMALDFEPGLERVGTAPSVAAALEQAAPCRPDVVLMDVRLPDGDGISATAALVAALPSASVVVLTAGPEGTVLARAADAGAAGVVAKGTPLSALAAAVRLAAAGGVPVAAGDLAGLLAATARDRSRPGLPDGFDDDEALELLRILGQGGSFAAAAERLGVSAALARDRVVALAGAAGVRSTLELLVVAARHGLLP